MSRVSRYVSGGSSPSTANQELVPEMKDGNTVGFEFLKLSFLNKEACTIVINGEAELKLEANQGFECSYEDPNIHSFVIKESAINFNFVGLV